MQKNKIFYKKIIFGQKTMSNNYKLDRWHKLNAEERSWILLKSFKAGVITSEQASSLTGAYTLSWLSTFAAPAVLFPGFNFGLKSAFPGLQRRFGSSQLRVFSAALTFSTFLVWKYNNPFNASFLAEKDTLLNHVDE